MRVYGWGTVPMVYMSEVFRKVGGVVICIFEATQGEHFGLFGGHEDGIIDSGHWLNIFARSSEWAMTADICAGRGFSTAMPPLNVFCHIVWRCVTMRSVNAERPLAGSATSFCARDGYFD